MNDWGTLCWETSPPNTKVNFLDLTLQKKDNRRQADRYQVPRICFINKMDRTGASFENTCDMIVDRLGIDPLPIQLPIGAESNFRGVIDLFTMQALIFSDAMGANPTIEEIPADLQSAAEEAREKLVERISETDEVLIEKYLEGEDITNDELYAALRQAVIGNELVPVLCGTALKNKGVQPLLDAVVRYMPSPLDIPPAEAEDAITGEPVLCEADSKAHLGALVFKIATDPFIGRLAYVRVYSGTLKQGDSVYNPNRRRKERIGRLVQMHADKREDISIAEAGDIAAVVGLKHSFTGETLCNQSKEILLETIEFPEPVIQIAIEPKSKGDQDKMSEALHKLAEEDPTFRVTTDEQTGQTIIAGMGELHLDIIVDRLRREFRVQCNVGQPQVAYRETITQATRVQGRFVRQSGGRGQFGDVWLEIEPNEPGGGIHFEENIVGGSVPRDYFKAIEDGVREATANGVLAGYPVVDVRINLVDGSYHEVDSSEMAFKIAASMGFKEGCRKAKPALMEPIMRVESVVPEDYIGDVVGDINSRRGMLEGMDPRGNVQAIRALVPLSEMFGYATKLRSMTSGRGTFTMQFEKYQIVSDTLAEKLLKKD
ncbi:MAG: elongation factor G [Chloroflexota bacterium]